MSRGNCTNSVKSNLTRLSKRQKTDEDESVPTITVAPMENEVNSHSTPKRLTEKTVDVEESLDFENRSSPCLIPCTQGPSQEVDWDWKGSSGKSSTNDPMSTPKRTTAFQKKRNKNSPLLNKPIRRKGVKINGADGLMEFTAELQALREQIQTKNPNVEQGISSSTNIVKKVENNDFSPSDNKVSSTTKINTNEFDENFEDIDEDVVEEILKCSQEIEEKWKLENMKVERSASANSSKRDVSSDVDFRLVASMDSSSDNSKLSANSRKSFEFAQPQATVTTNKPVTLNNNVMGKEDKKNSENSNDNLIPDDSLDDFLATFPDEEENLPSQNVEAGRSDDKNVNKYGKVYVSPHSKKSDVQQSSTKNTNSGDVNNKNNLKVPVVSEYKKFFKSKSLSDSHFDVNTKPGEPNSRVKLNFSKTNSSSALKSYVSNNQVNTISDASSSIDTLFEHNESNFENWDVNSSKNTKDTHTLNNEGINNNGSNAKKTTFCTPEEIERKRLEALKRLEAKKKLHVQSKLLSQAQNKQPVQRPVKSITPNSGENRFGSYVRKR